MLDAGFTVFGRYSAAEQMDELVTALKRVITTDAAVESIHQVRVRSRRLRSRLSLFDDVWPSRTVRRGDRAVRRLTKVFGPLRDTDVKQDGLVNYLKHNGGCPELHQLTTELTRRRTVQGPEAVAAAEAFLKSDISKSFKSETSSELFVGVLTPYLFTRVYQSVSAQIQAVLSASCDGGLPTDGEALHVLRISVKQLRYSVEALVPAYPNQEWEGILEYLKQLQSLLGEVHDADVWLESLGDCCCTWQEGVCFRDFQEVRRAEAWEGCRELWSLGSATGFWDTLRCTISEAARLAALTDIPDSMGVRYLQALGSPDTTHVEQVSRLALLLFDGLQVQHGLGTVERALLQTAAALHDIGWLRGQRRHHKTGLTMIMASSVLPWDARERLLVGSIVRYHRRAEPQASHAHWRALSAHDQYVVAVGAGLLRAADALDRSHTSAVGDVLPSVGDSLVLRVTGTDGVLDEFAGCEAKGQLLASVLGFANLRCERG